MMKSAFVKVSVLSLSLIATFANARPTAPVHMINLDWNDTSTLSDSIVMMCDDTVLSAVKIVVPGKPYENFTIDMVADVTTAKAVIGCSIKKSEGHDSTTYTLDADNGGCDIRVHKVRQNHREKPQSAEYFISDAC